MAAVLCPGVKLVAPRKPPPAASAAADEAETGAGFGPCVQTVHGDVIHLRALFPGESRKLLKQMLKDSIPPESVRRV